MKDWQWPDGDWPRILHDADPLIEVFFNAGILALAAHAHLLHSGTFQSFVRVRCFGLKILCSLHPTRCNPTSPWQDIQVLFGHLLSTKPPFN